jgi:hypothetical protein
MDHIHVYKHKYPFGSDYVTSSWGVWRETLCGVKLPSLSLNYLLSGVVGVLST